jgi:hypothetical protein
MHLTCWLFAQARRLLSPVGGCIVQVHMEAGGRVSYGPYRAAGKALVHLLKRCAPAACAVQVLLNASWKQPVRKPAPTATALLFRFRGIALLTDYQEVSSICLTAALG